MFRFIQVTLVAFFLSVCAYADTLRERLENHLQGVAGKIPGLTLVSDEINYHGLNIHHFTFSTGKKYIIAHPNEEFFAELDYNLSSEELENFDLHHFVYGIYPSAKASGCLLHSLGFRDLQGHTRIYFKAPEEEGFYEVRLWHSDAGIRCQKIMEKWGKKAAPSPSTTLGIIAVTRADYP